LAEAYRTLRSAVLLDCEPSQRRILVTSSQPEEGKTTVSLNLACSLAQLGRRVLLVDADLRRPNCARQLGIRPRQTLSDYLQGHAEVDDVILETSVPGLSLVAGGCSPNVASDLISSPRLASLLARTAERYDHVIIDSPPSLALSDARVMARLVESVILVVSGTTERAALLRTKQAFDQAGVRLLGFVMNRVDLSHPHYDYYRAYGYDGDAGERVG
jgi:capsular exopolysaccharide synthesis family protein